MADLNDYPGSGGTASTAPTVAVIVPVYNAVRFVERGIQSVVARTYH